jgi:hypothetical protein
VGQRSFPHFKQREGLDGFRGFKVWRREIVSTPFLAPPESNYIAGSTFFVDGGLLWKYQEQ